MFKFREHLIGLLQAIQPSFISKNPHFSFITAHYFWIVGWTIIGSILFFTTAQGTLHYIDALAFSAGANTQAGLNTVDVNLLNTFQQLLMYFLAMLSNPITINAFVVYLRLYWFEKRFQHVVKEAGQRRTTITKTRSRAIQNVADLEKGVNGRDITVIHNTAKASRNTTDGTSMHDPGAALEADQSHLTDTTQTEGASTLNHNDSQTRSHAPQIKFSDQILEHGTINEDDDMPVQLPQRRSNAEHIAIVEKQRKAGKSVLRIPGPRDADRGALPEELEEEEEDGLEFPHMTRKRRESSVDRPLSPRTFSMARQTHHPDRPQTITIEEPKRPWREGSGRQSDAADNADVQTQASGTLRFRGPLKDAEHLSRADTATSSAVPQRPNTLQRIRTALTQNKDDDPMPYLSWQPTLGRNSAFIGLTEDQREELGGIEYRSLKTLAAVLAVYFWGFTIFGIVCLVPWILNHEQYYVSILKQDGINPTWWGFFTANSAFTDLGFTLTPDSMNSFNRAIFPLLIMSFLIVIGNTGFPIMLRFMIWLASLVVPTGSGVWEELRFLLDHPRRCFTLLFPSNATWWLLFILVALNCVDLVLFIILDLGTGVVTKLPLNIRFLDGWFQAASTRTAGFSCVNIANLHPAIQTSYMIMMYISVFPVAISIRRTNVYEEKSLGVYAHANETDDDQSGMSYVGTHLRRQLSFDLWYIFIGFFILTISEGARLQSGDFSMFAVLFEIVSAYGTVGLSFGYTNINASLCSQFSVVGKLVIIAMMIRGRHRGLPYGLDRAVLLPSEHLNRKEEEVAAERRQSTLSVGGLSGRPASLSRGRSRSVDRRNVFAGLLHPGPTFPHPSMANVEQDTGFGKSETLQKYTTDPKSSEYGDMPEPVSPRTKTGESQPAFNH
ncbi:cation transport protein-domain-containing protein [Xylariaceae sp. FL0804]|nr:cation transport protein-domain-containing protein [Xylariaceae sp. FL0804]